MEPECECDIAARRQGRMRYARARTKVERGLPGTIWAWLTVRVWGAACGAWLVSRRRGGAARLGRGRYIPRYIQYGYKRTYVGMGAIF